MEEKPLYGGLTAYRERGAYLRRLEQFEKAKQAYDEAYTFNPDDIRMLIGRSQVCSDAVQPDQAYADAELALNLDPNHMVAKNTQARAMFTMSDFERSVVINYRGARLRQQPPYFNEGIIQGLETLQDCVGTNAGNVMMDFLPIIRTMKQTYGGDLDPAPVQRVSRIPKMEAKARLSQLETRKHETLSRVMAMKYLGPMAYDKFFLKALTEDARLKSANASGSRQLQKMVKDDLNNLIYRQEMLRSQRPYYAIKNAEKSESTRLTKFKKVTLKKDRNVGAMNVEKLFREIYKSLRCNRMTEVIFKAERLQRYLDSRTPRNLPDINSYVSRLYTIVGNGYLTQYRVPFLLSEKSKRQRTHFLLGLPVNRPTSYDSVMINFPHKFTDKDVEISTKLKQLDICENSYMRCWLYYELARLEMSKKNYALSNLYAIRCQKQAHELDSHVWWLNGCFILMSGDIQRHNTYEFKVHIKEAFERCKHLSSSESISQVESFLLECMEVAAEPKMLVSERMAELKREKQILSILDERSKVEASVLFKRMAAVPSRRRFSVLPKMQEPLLMTSERRKPRQLGLTVVPGKEKRMKLPRKASVAGFQIFEA